MSYNLRIFQTAGDPVDLHNPSDSQVAEVEKVMREQEGFFEFEVGSTRTVIAGKSIIRLVVSTNRSTGSTDYA